tara:strand:+ start:865 stop:1149 length:285 start_codon:yes stop_codon:yes gene_type:complete
MTIQGMNINNWNSMIPFRARRKVEDHLQQRVTQSQFGEWLGYSNKSVSGWETGKHEPEVAMKAIFLLLLDNPDHIKTIRRFTAKGDGDGTNNGS